MSLKYNPRTQEWEGITGGVVVYPKTMNYKEWKDRLQGKIKNLETLPGGLKCKYLVLIAGEGDNLIAKQWKRNKPELQSNEYLLSF